MSTELSLADLQAYRGQGGGQRSGKQLRFYCPLHGGDHQRSLSVDPDTGIFFCHSCQKTGKLTEYKTRWREDRAADRRPPSATWSSYVAPPKPPPAPQPGLVETLAGLQAALTEDSPGGQYLQHRGFSLDLARRYGLGWAAAGAWPHISNGQPVRQWKDGRLVFPHTDPNGDIVSLYGRACGRAEDVPKASRHDHLPGPKGNFNAAAWNCETVYVCEGGFDCLAMLAAGYPNTVGIFGVNDMRWEWARHTRRVVFCLDQDDTGRKRLRELSLAAMLAGKTVCHLPPAVYHGFKDLAELWQAGGMIDLDSLADELGQGAT